MKKDPIIIHTKTDRKAVIEAISGDLDRFIYIIKPIAGKAA
jgi:hypothetical protein